MDEKTRSTLEQKFIREERNQFRKNKQNKNVRSGNKGPNKSRGQVRSSGNKSFRTNHVES